MQACVGGTSDSDTTSHLCAYVCVHLFNLRVCVRMRCVPHQHCPACTFILAAQEMSRPRNCGFVSFHERESAEKAKVALAGSLP